MIKKCNINRFKILSILGILVLVQHSNAWQAMIKVGGDNTPLGSLVSGQNKVCFNGEPLDMVYDSVTGRAVIGGNFTRAGKCTGTGVIVNSTLGELTSNYKSSGSELVGTVTAAISDGGTGYFVAGDLMGYDGTSRNRVLKLNSSGTVNTIFFPDIPFNKTIRALAFDGTSLFVGGQFDSMTVQKGVLVDAEQGTQITNLANSGSQFNGDVKAILPDGFGGWYVGGEFTHYNGTYLNESRIVHLMPDGSLDTFFKPVMAFSGSISVTSLALDGNTLYVGGNFDTVNGNWRPNLFDINVVTGIVSGINYQVNGGIAKILDTGSTLIVSGLITSMGGQPRNFLGELVKSSGLATAWNPNPNSTPLALFKNSNTLYLGGFFTNIGGQSRNYLASYDMSTGLLNAWNPNPDNNVRDFSTDGTHLFVSGYFENISGFPRAKLASFNLSDNSLTSWQISGATITAGAEAHIYHNGKLYVTANQINGNRWVAAFDSSSGVFDSSWDPNPDDLCHTLSAYNNQIFIGGRFNTISNSKNRSYLAKLNPTTGAVQTAFNSNSDNSVYALAVDASALFVGGEFNNIGGQARNRLVKLNKTNGNDSFWNPSPTSHVNSLFLNGTTLYVGGAFTNIAGQNRNHAAAIDTSSGSATAFDPNVSSTVNTIHFDGANVYLGGAFTTVGGIGRAGLASVNPASGSLNNAWNPSADGEVKSITSFSSNIYVGGNFTQVAGQPRNFAAAIDSTTGNATPWNPNPFSNVNSIVASGSNIFLGGVFSSVGGLIRNYLAAVDMSTGSLTNWAPTVNGVVKTVMINASRSAVYIGGDFTMVSGQSRNRAAALSLTNPNAALIFNPNLNNSVHKIVEDTGEIYLAGAFTTVGVTGQPYLAKVNSSTGIIDAGFAPAPPSAISTFEVSGSYVYTGFVSQSVGNRLKVYQKTNGIFTNFTPDSTTTNLPGGSSGAVKQFIFDGNSSVFFVGDLGGVNSTAGTPFGLGSCDITSFPTGSCQSRVNNNVISSSTTGSETIAKVGNILYVGGLFTHTDSATTFYSRSNLAALSLTYSSGNGGIMAWDPKVNGKVNKLLVSGSNIFAVGTFTSAGKKQRQGITSVTRSTGLSNW